MIPTTNSGDCARAKHRFTSGLSRRSALGLLTLGGAMAVAGRGRSMAKDRVPQALRFLAFVDGSRSGTQDIEFVPREQGFTVMSSLSIRLELLFVTVYRFQQTSQEDWKNGKLIAFEYITNDDGDISHVAAKRDDDGNFLVTGPTGQRTAPGDAMSPSFWSSEILNPPHLIDPRTGELVGLAVRPLEQKSARIARRTIHGRGYAFDTFINGTLWFDEYQRSLALSFERKGRTIDVVREG